MRSCRPTLEGLGFLRCFGLMQKKLANYNFLGKKAKVLKVSILVLSITIPSSLLSGIGLL